MAERLNAAVLKTVDVVRRPGVQIPPLPPEKRINGLHGVAGRFLLRNGGKRLEKTYPIEAKFKEFFVGTKSHL